MIYSHAWVVVESKFNHIDVIPLNDLKEHGYSWNCWCHPSSDETGVCVHKAMDQRELYESGERKLS